MEARSERATSEAEVPSGESPSVAASPPQSDSARHVVTTDAGGALLYLVTLAGELVSGLVAWAAAAVLLFVTGHSSGVDARLIGWIAGLSPLVWSLCALAFPSRGWWWSTGAGARRPSARERARIEEALALR